MPGTIISVILSKNNDNGFYVMTYSKYNNTLSGLILSFEIYEVKGIIFSKVSSEKNVDIYYI